MAGAVRRGALVALLLLGASACGDAGAIELAFTWEVQPATTMYLWVRVEERPGGTWAGTTLASAGPVAYEPGQPLDLPTLTVAEGDRRVVVVEVRSGEDPGLPILYFGVSPPFRTTPGESAKASVALALRVPLAREHVPEAWLVVGDRERPEHVRPADAADVTLRTRSAHAVQAILASNAGFSEDVSAVALSGVPCRVEPDTAAPELLWDVCDLPAGDLTHGGRLGHGDSADVFVRFRDALGYESEPVRVSVALDGQPPALLSATLEPAVIGPGQRATVTVELDEPLEAGELSLSQDGGAALGAPTALGPTALAGGAPRFRWELFGGAEGATYSLDVTLTDAAGNASAPIALEDAGAPLALTVDTEAPRLDPTTPLGIAKRVFNLADAASVQDRLFQVDFVVLEANPVASDAGACPAGCPAATLGGLELGEVVRQPELDDPSRHALGFSYRYEVREDHWGPVEVTPQLVVTWADAVGQQATLPLDTGLTLDFVRPTVTCSVTPWLVPGDATALLVVEADEPLAEPELTLDGAVAVGALDSADPTRWAAPVTATDPGATTSFAATTVAEDLAGNPQLGECAAQSHFDGEAPTLVEATLLTKVVYGIEDPDDPAGNRLELELKVAERYPPEDLPPEQCDATCPQLLVRWGNEERVVGQVAHQEALDDPVAGHVALAATWDVAMAPFGPIEETVDLWLRWQDAVGHPLEAPLGIQLTLDFVRPTAPVCYAVPPDEARGGAAVAMASEPLAPDGVVAAWRGRPGKALGPLDDDQAGPLEQSDGAYTVPLAHDVAWAEVAFELTDAAGNRSDGPACQAIMAAPCGEADGTVVDTLEEGCAIDPPPANECEAAAGTRTTVTHRCVAGSVAVDAVEAACSVGGDGAPCGTEGICSGGACDECILGDQQPTSAGGLAFGGFPELELPAAGEMAVCIEATGQRTRIDDITLMTFVMSGTVNLAIEIVAWSGSGSPSDTVLYQTSGSISLVGGTIDSTGLPSPAIDGSFCVVLDPSDALTLPAGDGSATSFVRDALSPWQPAASFYGKELGLAMNVRQCPGSP